MLYGIDAEQDHDFARGGRNACGDSTCVIGAIVRPRQRTKSEGLSTTLLCQYDLLCHVAKEYSSFVAAARQGWLCAGDKCDVRTDDGCYSAASIIR
jgi:hypothetical protein